jgi:1-acyl-sn-glycerol-3-phosphate acyltransferase
MQPQLSTGPTLREAAYGLACWVTFTLVALGLVAVVAILPGISRRRAATRWGARLFLALAAARPRVSGLEQLPDEPCVVVANHASYLDGVILTAVLPPRFAFVIKREMTRVPLVHFLLRRIGSQFVERFDTRRGAADARRILALAESQHSLAFFPEGTFRPEPGLRRFQSGAFAAAARGRTPVVPVVIRGSRAMLGADMRLPRRTPLEVIVKPPVRHNGEDDAVATLRTASRDSILEELAEPDLVAHGH